MHLLQNKNIKLCWTFHKIEKHTWFHGFPSKDNSLVELRLYCFAPLVYYEHAELFAKDMQTLFLSILYSKFYLRRCWCALIPNQCFYNDFVPLEAFRRHTYTISARKKIYFLILQTTSRLTHWGRVTHICSDNDLSPRRRQAIIWTIAGILSIRRVGTILGEVLSI